MSLIMNEEELEPADVHYSSRSAVGEQSHRADVFYYLLTLQLPSSFFSYASEILNYCNSSDVC